MSNNSSKLSIINPDDIEESESVSNIEIKEICNPDYISSEELEVSDHSNEMEKSTFLLEADSMKNHEEEIDLNTINNDQEAKIIDQEMNEEVVEEVKEVIEDNKVVEIVEEINDVKEDNNVVEEVKEVVEVKEEKIVEVVEELKEVHLSEIKVEDNKVVEEVKEHVEDSKNKKSYGFSSIFKFFFSKK